MPDHPYDKIRIERGHSTQFPCAHGSPVNAGYGWNWTGRQRWDGRVRKYFTRGSYGNKQEFIDHIAAHLPNVEVIDAGPADKEPLIVMPIPPESFQFGILREIERELSGERSPLRTLPRTIIPRTRILAPRR